MGSGLTVGETTATSAVQQARGSARQTVRGLASDWSAVAVLMLAMVTFVARFSQMHQSLLGDEFWTYQDITGRTLAQVIKNVHTGAENSPPLFFILAYATAKLGNPIFWIRLPSIFFGAALLPVIYLIGRDTVGRVQGLAAATFVAISPFSMYYGVEARPYATMAFFTALSTWALIRAVERRNWHYWALYTVAAALACYSHYTCAFVLIVQGAWSLWACRDHFWRALVPHMLVVVLYIPWLPYLRGKALDVIGTLEPLTVHNVLLDAARTLVGYPYAPLRAIPTYVGLAIVVCCAVIGFVLLVRFAQTRGPLLDRRSWPHHFWLLVALALANPVLLLLYSIATTDLWLARNLYASMPAQALVLATLVLVPHRRATWALAVAVAAVLGLGVVRSISPTWQRTPYYTIARYLDAHASPNQPIEFDSFFGGMFIPMLFDHPHRIASDNQFTREAHGAQQAFVVEDAPFAKGFHIATPPAAPPGMRIDRRIRYHNRVIPGTEIIVYQSSGHAR